MVRREKTTIFLDCKEATTVYELKKMVEGILKKAPEDQRLYKDDQVLDDTKTLEDCGFTTQTAKAQTPALISLSFRGEGSLGDNVQNLVVLKLIAILMIDDC